MKARFSIWYWEVLQCAVIKINGDLIFRIENLCGSKKPAQKKDFLRPNLGLILWQAYRSVQYLDKWFMADLSYCNVSKIRLKCILGTRVLISWGWYCTLSFVHFFVHLVATLYQFFVLSKFFSTFSSFLSQFMLVLLEHLYAIYLF